MRLLIRIGLVAALAGAVLVGIPQTGAAPVIDVYANPGGWPQGLSFDRRGRLFATSHRDPIVSVESDGSVREYRKMKGADLVAARNGTVYVVTISFREDVSDRRVALVYDVLEANPNDQLVAYDPTSDSIEVLLSDLYMPAGVALSADGSFVVVTEATAYRVRRYWLEGPRAGTSDLLVESLPGFPDGIASDGAGAFYVALPVLRSEILDRLQKRRALRRRPVSGRVTGVWRGRRLQFADCHARRK